MGSLKAAIALLPDRELSNRVSAAAFAIHAATGGRLLWPRMSSHLSLEQPFEYESLPKVERVFDQVAAEVGPLVLTLGGIEIQRPSQHSPETVVWVGVRDTPELIELQQRLARELSPLAAGALVPFDAEAPGSRFHLTVGFLPAENLITSAQLPEFSGSVVTLRELGLFLYDGLPRAGWQCMLYARRPLADPRRVDAVHLP